MLDFLAAVYLAWLWTESGGGSRRWVVAAILAATIARGTYVMWVEHAGSPVVRVDVPADEWSDAMRWLSASPPGTHVLADPGHVYKYGSSVRVSSRRDVCLEEVTDTALAMYSRDAALAVRERIRDLENFDVLTPDRAGALTAKYDLDFLVLDRAIDLPVVYRNARFSVYRLR
jgi:hypothetical protein